MRLMFAIIAAVFAGVYALQPGKASDPPLILGLDHIPLAVKDLETAAETYRRLGFTLKPGRPHANGIQNLHIKFPDGTEIELITAAEPRDALTAEYLRHLAQGDGPAFVALFAPDLDRLAKHLESFKSIRRENGLLSFPQTDALRSIFFSGRNKSPTDRPEHFRHANGAESLICVWIAGDDLSSELDLLADLGASIRNEEMHIPDAVQGTVCTLPLGEILFLPGSLQFVPGRKIVGATIRVRDIRNLHLVLADGPWDVPPIIRTKHGSSVFLSPDVTHGIWLEFREQE